MTNPFSASEWKAAGWTPPTPHQVLALLMLIAAVIALAEVGPAWLAKVCIVLTAGTGGAGIASAKNSLSPQIKQKLQAVDALGISSLRAAPVDDTPVDEVQP